jgi:hypothetical protein
MKERIYKIVSRGFVFREEDDGALVFNPDTGNIQALNRTGAIIWKSCKRGATLSKLVKILKNEFPAEEISKIKKDISLFIKQLKKGKMIIEI